MLYCIYIIVKRSYPALRVRVINCEIRIVIYTLFRLFGSECHRKEDWRKWGVNNIYYKSGIRLVENDDHLRTKCLKTW